MERLLATPSRRDRATALGLVAVAVLAAIALAPGDRHRQIVVVGSALVVATLAAVLAIQIAIRTGGAWHGARHFSTGLLLVAIGELGYVTWELAGRSPIRPGPLDALFLLPLIAFARGAHEQFRRHLAPQDVNEVEADVVLITASLGAILFLGLRPVDVGTGVTASAMVFSVLAAAQIAVFGGLALWAPTRQHFLLFLIQAALAVGIGMFGWEWTRGATAGFSPIVVLTLALCPIASAALMTMTRSEPETRPPSRLARPILANLSVLAACAALAVVATYGDSRQLNSSQSSVIIAMLCVAIAARIVANQLMSTTAHSEVTKVLAEKNSALQETDVALDRVREANDTLRRSEEHLRLVFDTAVDGIVELSRDGRIVRANEAFCRMLGMDIQAIEGQSWTAVAAAVDDDGTLAGLPEVGHAHVRALEGQTIHLESRVSELPTDPPRKLLLVRDVTAAKVADQTIRSLFQFLQDRDEDRTRLQRRMNAAIEAERNRVARDLHDGPVQGVSAASLSLEAALLMLDAGDVERSIEVLTKIREELGEEADALRRLMSGLRPPVLEERGLIPALRDTLARFGAEHEIQTSLQGTIANPVPDDLETLAFRVVQEALTNVAKHAKAKSITVSVSSDPTQLRVEVEDDGVGFETGRQRDFLRAGRVGLAGMKERVELASGVFMVRSAPERGTTVMAALPIDANLVTRDLLPSDAEADAERART